MEYGESSIPTLLVSPCASFAVEVPLGLATEAYFEIRFTSFGVFRQITHQETLMDGSHKLTRDQDMCHKVHGRDGLERSHCISEQTLPNIVAFPTTYL